MSGPAEHGNGSEEFEDEDEFGEGSVTWGAGDPDFDRMLRDRIGPVESMPTPPFAFERVLLAGRRRRARKLWGGAAAAAFVMMTGTAGVTVALSGPTGNLAVASSPTANMQPYTAAPKASAPSAPAPSTKASPTPSVSAGTASPSASATGTPQCRSTDLKPSASAIGGTYNPSTHASMLMLVLTNTSGHACVTEGYPGLQFAPAGGSPLQSVTETRAQPGLKHQVVLPPKGSVATPVEYQTMAPGASPGPSCYTPSVYVLVIVPNNQNQVMSTIQGGPITICGNGAVSLEPLTPGTGTGA